MGADSVGFDTIRDSDFQVRTLDLKLTQLEIQKIKLICQRNLWAVVEDRYGAGGRAFLNLNMPGYDILDGAIDGGLDPECKFEL